MLKRLWKGTAEATRISSRIALRGYRFAARFGRDERGVTAIEYGLMVTGIAIAILATTFALGTQLNGVFNSTGAQLRAAASGCLGSGTASDTGLTSGQGSGCGQQ
jgi:pilus assembly protein Flp/PilA